MHTVPAALARFVIARLGDAELEDSRLGQIELRPHQLDAVVRLKEMLRHSGGAILADEAGLGKTYVALAVARTARSPLVIAPAALRPMWAAAMQAAGVTAAFDSYERLSRNSASALYPSNEGVGNARRTNSGQHDLIVLDEAHHARNPVTRRYRAIADVAVGASVLMLSATPVHNRRRDLEALIALYLGQRAASLTEAELSAHVYRRERDSIDTDARLPETGSPVWLHLPSDDEMLEALVALPPPVPPADGGDGGALLVHGLVRQWASTDGALRGALRRRAARASALIDALAAGRHPTRAELRSWTFGEGAVQLAFPELMASGVTTDSSNLLRSVQLHGEAVGALIRSIVARPSLDAERARIIRDIRSRHRNEKVVAFTAYADSAAALYRELCGDGGVAMLTAEGGLVAGGHLTRRETIEAFAPLAQGVRPPRDAERIDMLLATDLLSEGMNLQDASVVIHLDLPWTPARLEQRVGRAARLGSMHQRVAVYTLAPPASAERLIEVEKLLRQKLGVARSAIGGLKSVLPPRLLASGSEVGTESPAEVVRLALARWRRQRCVVDVKTTELEVVASVRALDGGFLAAVETSGGAVLLAGSGAHVGTEPALVARAVAVADGPDCDVVPADLEAARAAISRWAHGQRAARSAGAGPSEPLRRQVIGRIAGIAGRTPAHRRPIVAMLSAAARRATALPMGAGAERRLATLASATMPDDEWLRAVADFSARSPAAAEGELRVIGIVLFRPAERGGALRGGSEMLSFEQTSR